MKNCSVMVSSACPELAEGNHDILRQAQDDKSILLIDKPKGMSSFDVIRHLRRKLGIKKMGHAGTLDPLATGLIIIAVGKATKKISEYMGMPKEYEVTLEFGKTSTSYDADGEITEIKCAPVIKADLEKVLPQFIGTVEQTPPIFSAIKINGVRAYKLARKGEKVELKPRTINISKIEILNFAWPFADLRVNCGKGTYIRSLVHDIGQKLGCGAYVKELRRTKIGEFKVEDAVKF